MITKLDNVHARFKELKVPEGDGSRLLYDKMASLNEKIKILENMNEADAKLTSVKYSNMFGYVYSHYETAIALDKRVAEMKVPRDVEFYTVDNLKLINEECMKVKKEYINCYLRFVNGEISSSKFKILLAEFDSCFATKYESTNLTNVLLGFNSAISDYYESIKLAGLIYNHLYEDLSGFNKLTSNYIPEPCDMMIK